MTTNHPSAKIIESEIGGETLIKDNNPELKVYVRKKIHKGGANPIVSPIEIQSDLPSEGPADNLSSSSSSGNPSYSSNDLFDLSFPYNNLPIFVRKNILDLDVPIAERKGSVCALNILCLITCHMTNYHTPTRLMCLGFLICLCLELFRKY